MFKQTNKIAIFSLALIFLIEPLSLFAATERVSLADDEIEANAATITLAVSSDGRYIAFLSTATNLVPTDSDTVADVFVRDRTLGTTELISVSTAGVKQDVGNSSGRLVISPDGRYVLFLSNATNLVAGDGNGKADAFIRDRQLGTTEIVSIGDDESIGNGNSAVNGATLAMTPDGRYIVFQSVSTNLVAGDSNVKTDVFLRDRTLGTTEIVSLADDESLGNANTRTGVAISDDGRYIAFNSAASNLVAGDSNGNDDTFLRDRTLGTTERISVSDGEAEVASGIVTGSTVSISSDGRYVTFVSDSDSLVTGDSGGIADVFVRDRTLGTTERVSVADDESQANALSGAGVAISDSGRYVTFYSTATNLVPGDTNAHGDIFIRDRTLGTTKIASYANDDSLGNADVTSGHTAMSPNGTYVGFLSAATNLVSGDSNAVADAFVYYLSGGDSTPPAISSVASTTGETTATITWNTDEAASSSARFGLSTSYGTTSTSTGTSTHSVSLSGLTSNTLYHFALYATDSTGNSATTTDYTFTTTSGAPTITNISSDKADGTYGVGEVIDIDVTFSEAVTSTGLVTVTLETGSTDRTCTFTVSNSTTGTCNYTVQAGDNSLDLSVSSVSGTIKDADDNSMVSFSPGVNLNDNKEIVIDGVSPAISSVATSSAITTATVDWTTDESADSAIWYGTTSGVYTTSTSSSALRTSQSLTMTGLSGGTLYYFALVSRDAYGNTSTSTEYSLTTLSAPDTTAPVISNVASSTTTTTATITWNTNENSTSTVNFGATTGYGTASSSSSLTSSHQIILSGLTPSTTYHFQVSSGDAAFNYATSSDYTFTTADVDVTAPTLTSFTSGSADGTYTPGDTVTIVANFNESLTATSTLTITLDTGASVILSSVSGSTITGTYTVSAGENSNDLTVSSITGADVSDTSYNRSTSYSVPATPNNLGDDANIVVTEEAQNERRITTGSRAKSKVKTDNNTPQNPPKNDNDKAPLCELYLKEFISVLGNNSKGEVEKLQTFLNEFENESLSITGTYDKETIDAVKRFQAKYSAEILLPWGLKAPTGFVYTTTKAKINALNCGKSIGCPFFTEYAKVGENKEEVKRIKNFLNILSGNDTLAVDSSLFDSYTLERVKDYQNRYKGTVLLPWGLSSATGYWYKTTKASANTFMGCVDVPIL